MQNLMEISFDYYKVFYEVARESQYYSGCQSSVSDTANRYKIHKESRSSS